MTQPKLPLPNPGDWTDTNGAAELIGRNRTTLYDYVNRNIITKYEIGSTPVYWVPEILEVSDALDRLGKR